MTEEESRGEPCVQTGSNVRERPSCRPSSVVGWARRGLVTLGLNYVAHNWAWPWCARPMERGGPNGPWTHKISKLQMQ